MWNEHLQEVTDELVTTLKELPVPNTGVLDNIKSRLAIDALQPTRRTLKRVPLITHPEHRVEQRVAPNLDANAAPLQHITEAPPIMAAPNLTAKHTLKMTKRMHS
jgi:hypothetical protein